MKEIELPRTPAARVWLETGAITVLALAALVWWGPSPYLALAPLLVGVRYGSPHGLSSGAVLTLASMSEMTGLASVSDTSADLAALAWLIAGAVCGAFRDAWARRLRALQASADSTRLELESLARAHHALGAAHAQLQQQLQGQPCLLREALGRLRTTLVNSPGEPAFAERVLELLRDHAGVRAATWHRFDETRGPTGAIAALGDAANAGIDELIEHAARLGEVISVRDLHGGAPGSTLIAVPLTDVRGIVHAVVAIRELPFVTLHEDTLSSLAVLGGQLGDLLMAAHEDTLAQAPAEMMDAQGLAPEWSHGQAA
jgi:polysaccharide biosynthesis protein PelD